MTKALTMRVVILFMVLIVLQACKPDNDKSHEDQLRSEKEAEQEADRYRADFKYLEKKKLASYPQNLEMLCPQHELSFSEKMRWYQKIFIGKVVGIDQARNTNICIITFKVIKDWKPLYPTFKMRTYYGTVRYWLHGHDWAKYGIKNYLNPEYCIFEKGKDYLIYGNGSAENLFSPKAFVSIVGDDHCQQPILKDNASEEINNINRYFDK